MFRLNRTTAITATVVTTAVVLAVVLRSRPANVRSEPREVADRVSQAPITQAPIAHKAINATLPLEPPDDASIDDPSSDGWSSEVTADAALQILNRIGAMIVGDRPIVTSELVAFCDSDFYLPGGLTPNGQHVVFQDDAIKVSRGTRVRSLSSPTTPGSVDLEVALRDAAATWSTRAEPHAAFKIFRVVVLGDTVETGVYVTLSGESDLEMAEVHATWTIQWSVTKTKQLLLRSIEVDDYEATSLAKQASAERLFVDCTFSVIGKDPAYQQFLIGLNHWLQRNQDMRYFAPLGNPGLAVGDVNADGLDDLYVCQESNLPNRLLLQQPDGSARDVAAAWHVDWLQGSRSALLIDLDNDGDQDLVVAVMGGIVVAANERGHFAVRDVLPSEDDTTSLAAADYDLDGDLDLYACVDYPNDYFASPNETAKVVGIQGGAAHRTYHDANLGGRNRLFRNDTDSGEAWTFTDVTAECGIDQNNRRFSWAASWEDYDNDGDQDLYVANDFGRNNLYQNTDGKFVDVAAAAAAEDSASGMSAAWADVDRDGDMDLYVSNMFSSAGSRISIQPQFKPDATTVVRERLRRFARGSTLLSNDGRGKFKDVSVDAGVTLGRWAWGSVFVDINNDGWQDIAVANGYITNDDTSDL